jgi:hypothetical protein
MAKEMPKPEKGGKPKKIGEGMGSPGGPYTPGEKEKARREAAARRARAKRAKKKKKKK